MGSLTLLGTPSARVPESLARYSVYAAESELPAARRLMASLLETAQHAATRHEGVALSRRE